VAEKRLSVQADQLLYSPRDGEAPAPLQGYDYLLLRVEGRAERDDWRLKDIQGPLDQAKAALIQGRTEEADAFKKATLAAAWLSPDLAVQDRSRVVRAIKAEWAQIEAEGLGAVADEALDLNAIMATRALAPALAANLGRVTAAEVFGD
jgi:hypothetical protein